MSIHGDRNDKLRIQKSYRAAKNVFFTISRKKVQESVFVIIVKLEV